MSACARSASWPTHVMAQIGEVMPVTPVCLVAATLLRAGTAAEIERAEWETRIDAAAPANCAHAARRSSRTNVSAAELLDRALVMLTLRHIAEPVPAQGSGARYRIDRSQDPLLRYYANSIAHYFARPPLAAEVSGELAV